VVILIYSSRQNKILAEKTQQRRRAIGRKRALSSGRAKEKNQEMA